MNIILKFIISALLAALALYILQAMTLNISLQFVVIFIACLFSSIFSGLNISLPSKAKTSSKRATNKPSEGREQGKVKWFNISKGYGFISRDSGEEIFIHFRSINGKGRRILREGQRVEFIVTDGDKGPQAEDVDPLDD
ncbi:MAG: CspA family cold shock protein [Oceanicoccus sp.]|jgi:CspA family cold shock protein